MKTSSVPKGLLSMRIVKIFESGTIGQWTIGRWTTGRWDNWPVTFWGVGQLAGDFLKVVLISV